MKVKGYAKDIQSDTYFPYQKMSRRRNGKKAQPEWDYLAHKVIQLLLQSEEEMLYSQQRRHTYKSMGTGGSVAHAYYKACRCYRTGLIF